MRTPATKLRQALVFVRVLAGYECAGEPACEPETVDVATGKREGGLCGPCEAREWLENLDK